MLAMVVNDDAGFLKKRGAHTSIASRLAPTMVLCRTQNMCSLKQQSSPRPLMSFSVISPSASIPVCNLNASMFLNRPFVISGRFTPGIRPTWSWESDYLI